MQKIPVRAAVGALLALGTFAAHADSIDVDLAGWRTVTELGLPGNSETFVSVSAGATVTGYDYLDLAFTTSNNSWQNEFVLSVGDTTGTAFLDAAPSNVGAPGSFGPASGSWLTAAGGNGGAAFTVPDGQLWVRVYEIADDPLGDPDAALLVDATVTSGTLRIHFTPAAVPEPATYGTMALGMLGVAAALRRRQRQQQQQDPAPRH